MKNAFIVVAFVFVTIAFVSCATTGTTNQGMPQKTIPVISMVSGDAVPAGEEIASYTSFYGICIGYDDFVEKVKGRNFDVIVKNYVIFSKVIAVAK